MVAVARSVWHQDLSAARRLHADTHCGSRFICFDAARVTISDHEEFSNRMDILKHDYCSNFNFEVTGKSQNGADKVARLSRLWVPLHKSLVLSGVLNDSGVVRGAQAIAMTLGQEWSGTFSHKTIPTEEARSFLNGSQLSQPSQIVSIPTFEEFVKYLRKLAMSPSAPGPDGIPYAAWYHAGPLAWRTL